MMKGSGSISLRVNPRVSDPEIQAPSAVDLDDASVAPHRMAGIARKAFRKGRACIAKANPNRSLP